MKLDMKYKLDINGYNIYRSDKNSKGGGVALIIRKKIAHYLKSVKFSTIESITAVINTKFSINAETTNPLESMKSLMKFLRNYLSRV